MGPLLDANGWAVNAQARINVPFGGSLTQQAQLPEGSSRDMTDPFAETDAPWRTWVVIAVVVGLGAAWFWGALDRMLPAPLRSVTLLGQHAPADAKPVPAVAPAAAPPAG